MSMNFIRHTVVCGFALMLGSAVALAKDAAPSPLTVQIQEQVAVGRYSHPTNLTISVTFTNQSTNAVQLLDCFRPLPVFMAWNIKQHGQSQLDLPGAGKISFPAGALKYVTIPPHGTHVLLVKLSEFLSKSSQSLEEGDYEISVLYRNQYGENCLKGIFPSNTINVTLKKSGSREP